MHLLRYRKVTLLQPRIEGSFFPRLRKSTPIRRYRRIDHERVTAF